MTAPASPYGRAPSSGFRTVFSFDIAPLDLAIYAVQHRLAVGGSFLVPGASRPVAARRTKHQGHDSLAGLSVAGSCKPLPTSKAMSEGRDAAPSLAHPSPKPPRIWNPASASLRTISLDDSEHLLHNLRASVASLRLLFTFAPERRSASLRNQRSPSPEYPILDLYEGSWFVLPTSLKVFSAD